MKIKYLLPLIFFLIHNVCAFSNDSFKRIHVHGTIQDEEGDLLDDVQFFVADLQVYSPVVTNGHFSCYLQAGKGDIVNFLFHRHLYVPKQEKVQIDSSVIELTVILNNYIETTTQPGDISPTIVGKVAHGINSLPLRNVKVYNTVDYVDTLSNAIGAFGISVRNVKQINKFYLWFVKYGYISTRYEQIFEIDKFDYKLDKNVVLYPNRDQEIAVHLTVKDIIQNTPLADYVIYNKKKQLKEITDEDGNITIETQMPWDERYLSLKGFDNRKIYQDWEDNIDISEGFLRKEVILTPPKKSIRFIVYTSDDSITNGINIFVNENRSDISVSKNQVISTYYFKENDKIRIELPWFLDSAKKTFELGTNWPNLQTIPAQYKMYNVYFKVLNKDGENITLFADTIKVTDADCDFITENQINEFPNSEYQKLSITTKKNSQYTVRVNVPDYHPENKILSISETSSNNDTIRIMLRKVEKWGEIDLRDFPIGTTIHSNPPAFNIDKRDYPQKNIPVDRYTLTITNPWYNDFNFEIRIKEGKNPFPNINMEEYRKKSKILAYFKSSRSEREIEISLLDKFSKKLYKYARLTNDRIELDPIGYGEYELSVNSNFHKKWNRDIVVDTSIFQIEDIILESETTSKTIEIIPHAKYIVSLESLDFTYQKKKWYEGNELSEIVTDSIPLDIYKAQIYYLDEGNNKFFKIPHDIKFYNNKKEKLYLTIPEIIDQTSYVILPNNQKVQGTFLDSVLFAEMNQLKKASLDSEILREIQYTNRSIGNLALEWDIEIDSLNMNYSQKFSDFVLPPHESADNHLFGYASSQHYPNSGDQQFDNGNLARFGLFLKSKNKLGFFADVRGLTTGYFVDSRIGLSYSAIRLYKTIYLSLSGYYSQSKKHNTQYTPGTNNISLDSDFLYKRSKLLVSPGLNYRHISSDLDIENAQSGTSKSYYFITPYLLFDINCPFGCILSAQIGANLTNLDRLPRKSLHINGSFSFPNNKISIFVLYGYEYAPSTKFEIGINSNLTNFFR